MFRDLTLRHRHTYAAVFVHNSVALADYFALAVGQLLFDVLVQQLGVDFQLHIIFNIYSAADYVRDCKRVPLAVALNRVGNKQVVPAVLYLTEVHFYLVSYYTLTETADNSLFIDSVRIISAKKPLHSLLCSSDSENLTLGEQLRVMRLSAGFTIKQAADAVGIHRGTLMNYEVGRTMPKSTVVEKLIQLYKG